MKLIRRKWFIVLLVLLAIGIFAAFALRRSPQPQYMLSQPLETGDIREQVEATGTINAVTTVQVGSQVSGIIYKLNADFNSRVKKNEIIAEIEPSVFEGQLLQTKADLENARANAAAAQANLERSRATATQTKAEYERTRALAAQGVMSQQQLEVAKANAESAEAQVSASEAQVKQARAQVTQREAAVAVAQTNLNHTIIRAPIDGTVVARNVDVGQTVAASLQAPTLFTIAQDLTKMQVYAKTDESNVGQIRPGQRVTFTVDAFPRERFNGQVMQVRMNATVVQNVVTYDTVIEFENPEMKLFPGMTAYVTIPVAAAQDVLKVPNAALRYKPDMSQEQLLAEYAKHGIEVPRGPRGGMAMGGGEGAGGNGGGPGGGGGMQRRPQQAAGGGEGEDAAPQPRRERRVTSRGELAVVWKMSADRKTAVPVQVKTGITDRTFTELMEVVKGELKPGDVLVTGSTRAQGGPSAPPGMGGAPGMRGGRPR